jgi:hypothetical protein
LFDSTDGLLPHRQADDLEVFQKGNVLVFSHTVEYLAQFVFIAMRNIAVNDHVPAVAHRLGDLLTVRGLANMRVHVAEINTSEATTKTVIRKFQDTIDMYGNYIYLEYVSNDRCGLLS